MPFVSWLKDIEGKYLHINSHFLNLYSLEYNDVVNKTDFEIFDIIHANKNKEEENIVLSTLSSHTIQVKRYKDWYNISLTPIFSFQKQIIGISGIEQNITDNIQTINQLRKEKDLLKSLMDNIPDFIYFKDIHSRFIRVNKAKSIEVNLKDPDDIIGNTDFDYCDYEQALVKFNDEQNIIKTGIPIINKEERVSTKGASEAWYLSTKSPIRNAKGEIIGIVGISHDITNRKKIMQILAEEREHLQVIMDFIPYSIYLKDHNCRFTKINKVQANLLRLTSPDQVYGKTDVDISNTLEAHLSYEDDVRVIRSGMPQIEKVESYIKADGTVRWFSTTKIPIRDFEGHISGLVGISMDITEKMISERRLKEAKEKAEESDRLKTAFLANMSHEIRTPMNGIIGFSNLLKNSELTESEREEFLEHITTCGNSLLNLIDDIIDISKIEAGQIKVRLVECNINAILNEICSSFNAIQEKEGKHTFELRLSLGLDEKNSIIQTDPFRLRQIISNLIGNAFKFTFDGFIEFGYILDNQSSMLKFFVKDTGIGIPKEKQEIIFERFGQVLESGTYNHKGTGLGLAISNNLTKLLGGAMWVESEIEKGSTFFFTIPYNRIELKETDKKLENIVDEVVELAGKTILIAEDEDTNFLFFKELFKKSGVKLLWVRTGKDAVDAVRINKDISLVLMDCKMPEMDGFEATIQIKKIKPQLPIIAQTAFAMSDEREKCLSVGSNAYISKPINSNELYAILNKYLK